MICFDLIVKNDKKFNRVLSLNVHVDYTLIIQCLLPDVCCHVIFQKITMSVCLSVLKQIQSKLKLQAFRVRPRFCL